MCLYVHMQEGNILVTQDFGDLILNITHDRMCVKTRTALNNWILIGHSIAFTQIPERYPKFTLDGIHTGHYRECTPTATLPEV